MREAIEAAVTEPRKREVHAAVLRALSEPPWGAPDLARLAGHAYGTGDPNAALRFIAPAAARAARLGAHREAAALYEHALRHGDALPLQARARLLEQRAAQSYLLAEFEAAEPDQRQALACYGQLDDQPRRAAALTRLSNLVWETGSLRDAQPMAIEAVEQLERLGEGPELVGAYIQVAQLKLSAEAPEEAKGWALRACHLAEQLGRKRAKVAALTTLGWTEFFTGARSGLEKLERSIALAEAAGLEGEVAGAHVVIARTAARLRSYRRGHRHVGTASSCDGR